MRVTIYDFKLHIFTLIMFLFLQSTSAANIVKLKLSSTPQRQDRNVYARAIILNDWNKNDYKRTTRPVNVVKEAGKVSERRGSSKCQIGDHDDHFGEFMLLLLSSQFQRLLSEQILLQKCFWFTPMQCWGENRWT